MKNFSKVTTDYYGFGPFNDVRPLQVDNLKDAMIMFLEIIMAYPENEPVFVNGKVDTKQTLQNWVNDYGVVTFENMDSDGTEYTESIVGVEEVNDHLLNTFKWIIVNNTNIRPMLALEVLNEITTDWGIKDYDRTA